MGTDVRLKNEKDWSCCYPATHRNSGNDYSRGSMTWQDQRTLPRLAGTQVAVPYNGPTQQIKLAPETMPLCQQRSSNYSLSLPMACWEPPLRFSYPLFCTSTTSLTWKSGTPGFSIASSVRKTMCIHSMSTGRPKIACSGNCSNRSSIKFRQIGNRLSTASRPAACPIPVAGRKTGTAPMNPGPTTRSPGCSSCTACLTHPTVCETLQLTCTGKGPGWSGCGSPVMAQRHPP